MRKAERIWILSMMSGKELHKKYFQDWRFGQLCSNFFGWLMSEKGCDLFFS